MSCIDQGPEPATVTSGKMCSMFIELSSMDVTARLAGPEQCRTMMQLMGMRWQTSSLTPVLVRTALQMHNPAGQKQEPLPQQNPQQAMLEGLHSSQSAQTMQVHM